MATLTTTQLNAMTPQQRAAYYVTNLQAAAKSGTLTATQQAELSKYQAVAARPATQTAPAPIPGTPTTIPGQVTSSGTYYNGVSSGQVVNPMPSTDIAGAGNYVTAGAGGGIPTQGAWVPATGISEAAWYANNVVPLNVGTGTPNARVTYDIATGTFQTYVAPGQDTGPNVTGTPINIAGQTIAPGQVYTPTGAAPAGGNAASLVPTPAATSNITPQGSGTPNATGVLDTGTGAVTSVPSGTTGAGGSFMGGGVDTGAAATGTTTGGGITTADMILIGIGAVGLLLAMKGRKHAPVA